MKCYSEQLVNLMERTGSINSEERELYLYGIRQFINVLSNFLITVVIALWMDLFIESINLQISFLPLRIHAGGYHANTKIKCNLFSFSLVVLSLFLIKYIEWNYLFSLGMLVFAVGIIIAWAPLEDSNKPLDSTEIVVYRKRTRTILLLNILVVLISFFSNIVMIYSSITVGVFMVAVLLLSSKIRDYRAELKR